MMIVGEYIESKQYCTLRVGGQFRYFATLTSADQLPWATAFAQEKSVPLFVLGGGSNIVFSEGVLNALVLKIEIEGFDVIEDTDTATIVRVGAGMSWDAFVARTVALGVSGVEALSAIPGTVGATPVQNVGAYGQEVATTIVSVGVFDTTDRTVKVLSASECMFSYRDSVFKTLEGKRYIITNVTFKLSKGKATIPAYPGVAEYFATMSIEVPTLLQIREAIISIRSKKLPNPKEIANVGSFFKNPIVDISKGEAIQKEYSTVRLFPVDDHTVKIPAGWLIEQAGLKGYDFGSVCVYAQNALVLVNKGNASTEDIVHARNYIIEKVEQKFGIRLEQEPEMY